MRALAAVTGAAALISAACAPVLHVARRSADEPQSEREAQAAAQLQHEGCGRAWSLLFPGVGQLCHDRPAEGAALATLGAAELGLGVGVAVRHPDISFPGVLYPLVAFQDIWLASVFDARLEEARARSIPYIPQDSHQELLGAPLNLRALGNPWVWGGLIGLLGVDVGVSALQGETLRRREIGSPPNLFGDTYPAASGFTLGAALYGGLFEQVAVAEELFFRGTVQSGLTYRYGETTGWLLGSLIFGAAHTFNALFLPASQQASYLAVNVPVITLIGAYLGWVYRTSGYTLVPSTALHFWYDFLVSFGEMVVHPESSSFSARILRLP